MSNFSSPAAASPYGPYKSGYRGGSMYDYAPSLDALSKGTGSGKTSMAKEAGGLFGSAGGLAGSSDAIGGLASLIGGGSSGTGGAFTSLGSTIAPGIGTAIGAGLDLLVSGKQAEKNQEKVDEWWGNAQGEIKQMQKAQRAEYGGVISRQGSSGAVLTGGTQQAYRADFQEQQNIQLHNAWEEMHAMKEEMEGSGGLLGDSGLGKVFDVATLGMGDEALSVLSLGIF